MTKWIVIWYFCLVYSAFGLNTEDEIDVKLYTKDKYLIPPRQLPKLLLQFKLCSNFMIDVFFPTGAITTMSHEVRICLCFTHLHILNFFLSFIYRSWNNIWKIMNVHISSLIMKFVGFCPMLAKKNYTNKWLISLLRHILSIQKKMKLLLFVWLQLNYFHHWKWNRAALAALWVIVENLIHWAIHWFSMSIVLSFSGYILWWSQRMWQNIWVSQIPTAESSWSETGSYGRWKHVTVEHRWFSSQYWHWRTQRIFG